MSERESQIKVSAFDELDRRRRHLHGEIRKTPGGSGEIAKLANNFSFIKLEDFCCLEVADAGPASPADGGGDALAFLRVVERSDVNVAA